MDQILLWGLLIVGLTLFFYGMRKEPREQWITAFLLKAVITSFIGVIVIEEGLLIYPIRFLPQYFDGNILYDYLLLPVVCIYFYQFTHRAGLAKIFAVGVLLAVVMTMLESWFAANTNLIQYYSWTWVHTLVTVFLTLIIVRFAVKGLYKS